MADTDREGLPAISSCLCPCHTIEDADLKAKLEAQCKCGAVTKYFAETLGITDPDDEADTAAYLETRRDPFTPACHTSTEVECNCGEPCPCGDPEC